MAINIKFDLAGNPEPPTIILANRNGNKLGQLDVNHKSIDLSDKFNDASEFTFTLNKYYFDEKEEEYKITNLWDKVVDFKLVYCKEWDMWFEIKVELDEATETIKTVFCTQLGQAELSQIMLYNIEINTEKDIARDDYKITILYDENDGDASLLNRTLKDKAPHYRIIYVDPTIAKIQRSFSFDDTSILDAHKKIAEEIGCLFDYPSNSNDKGKIQRDIYVYDLQQNCKDCGHRGEFIDTCPKCGSKNIKYGYGEDTLIFVTSDELASDGIQLTTDTDSVKNCFKLEAGDDLMTATVRNCNPNGTDYIWRFSEDMISDMSDELVEKIKSYNELYDYYYNDYIYKPVLTSNYDDYLIDELESYLLDETETYLMHDENRLMPDYNALVDKYLGYYKGLEKIPTPIKGYPALMNAYYNTVDFALFLQSVLVPNYDGYLTDESDSELLDESDTYLMYKETIIKDTSSEEQAALLTSEALSPVSVSNIDIASLATVNSSVLAMAKIIVKSTYKVQVNNSELVDNGKTKLWTGNFIVTNYSNEEDATISETISVIINDDYESFIQQKIEKALRKESSEDLSISGLFKKEYDDFCDDLKAYALNPLISFRDACQACIDILIEQGVGNNITWADTTEGSDSNLYEKLYMPYYNKLVAIESEIKVREEEIDFVLGVYDTDGMLISEGVQSSIIKCKNEVQKALDFESYLGNKLWLEFCSYRREDKYSNENYISDGLDNAELFKRALEFFEVAENEIHKSSELQHSISTTLNNLLAIPKFKKLVESFKLGNWLRIQVDNRVYKLRLLEYGIDFGDFDSIPVEFSDVTKIKNGITDVESILSKASSMASSYSSVKRQASQGEKSNAVLNSWVDDGLNATTTKIVASENQNQVWDKNGILCRQYDPTTEKYSDEQLKIINSTIAITDNNWETTKTAIGRYYYTDPVTKELKSAYGVNGETIVGKFILGEQMSMQNESGSMVFDGNGMTITSKTDDGIGTMTFNEDGLIVNHGKNTVTISPKSEEVMNITNGEEKVFNISENGELSINGNIMARSLKLESGVKIDSGVITDLATVATSGSYNDLLDTPTKLSEFTNDSGLINKDVNNLTNYYNKNEVYNKTESYGKNEVYNKTETNNLLNSKVNSNSLSAVATTGSYSDLVDIEEFKVWILEQIQLATNQ